MWRKFIRFYLSLLNHSQVLIKLSSKWMSYLSNSVVKLPAIILFDFYQSLSNITGKCQNLVTHVSECLMILSFKFMNVIFKSKSSFHLNLCRFCMGILIFNHNRFLIINREYALEHLKLDLNRSILIITKVVLMNIPRRFRQ